MQPERLIIIGNGMVGSRLLEELLKRDRDRYHITLFGAEPHAAYNRILLSSLLAGDKSEAQIMFHDRSWYQQQQITLHLGETVTTIDPIKHLVRSDRGTCLHYDKLVLATGSRPMVPPIPGHDLPGVIALRTLDDTRRLLDACTDRHHAVVIGGGLLGLETAHGLLRQGMAVTVVHNSTHLMNRQLDETAARLLQGHLEQQGIRFMLNADTRVIEGDPLQGVSGVAFADGSRIDADLVVMAIGIRPNVDLARQTGLAIGRGITVDSQLRSSDPAIFAVGECVELHGELFGLVAPLYQQARALAEHLTGGSDDHFVPAVTSTQLKVTGVDLFSAGDFTESTQRQTLLYSDLACGIYKKLVLQDDRLIGAVLHGAVEDGNWYFDLIQNGTSVAGLRELLIFGSAFCAQEGAGTLQAA
ncbi:MAG TPA: FAD-dependent oxidoreductase [Pseudomonadales bacterium]|nr:FAD-dependent oxidoreductase [Pseudomonadales bacterium]HNH19611.1 FAD-dependent oxidoreductase [Pseudomonadales bacterium]